MAKGSWGVESPYQFQFPQQQVARNLLTINDLLVAVLGQEIFSYRETLPLHTRKWPQQVQAHPVTL